MNTNLESIPNHIFDWLEQFSFLSLSLEQQKEVLQYFTQEEFEDLYASSYAIKSLYDTRPVENSTERKKALLGKFQTHHQKKKTSFVLFSKTWQVAAAIVLLASGWMLNYVFPVEQSSSSLVASIDTVYLTKEISGDPLKIYDTIYIEKEVTNHAIVQKTDTKNQEVQTGSGDNSSPTIDEVDSPLNRQKRNSMKDDNLAKDFSLTIL